MWNYGKLCYYRIAMRNLGTRYARSNLNDRAWFLGFKGSQVWFVMLEFENFLGGKYRDTVISVFFKPSRTLSRTGTREKRSYFLFIAIFSTDSSNDFCSTRMYLKDDIVERINHSSCLLILRRGEQSVGKRRFTNHPSKHYRETERVSSYFFPAPKT